MWFWPETSEVKSDSKESLELSVHKIYEVLARIPPRDMLASISAKIAFNSTRFAKRMEQDSSKVPFGRSTLCVTITAHLFQGMRWEKKRDFLITWSLEFLA
ncbi:unnamed protein product [Arabis nemorensis]|uniref:Uncharacterized protein n=1 Tax=Arabis nemorensis TaxID=586526 RepID=A0A565BCQ7_9BRAS|nr:unnamed protein product [Arabis nemorensis]